MEKSSTGYLNEDNSVKVAAQAIHGNQGTLGSYDGMDGAEGVSSWAAQMLMNFVSLITQ